MTMSYAVYKANPAYNSKKTGAQIAVAVVDESSGVPLIVGLTTGLSVNEQFEIVPIEEAGNDGVGEIVQGRHSFSANIPVFWTPQRNDDLPTRQDFIGKSYTVYAKVAPGWPGEGVILNVLTGCRISDNSTFNVGARGAVTGNVSVAGLTRYNGQEWADKNGL